MIGINNLKKSYGNFSLELPAIELPAGSCVGLVGANGAGKTTLLKAMLDLIPLDQGSISLFGQQVNRSEEWKSFTRAYISEDFLIGYLTPREYFKTFADLYKLDPDLAIEQVRDLGEFVGEPLLNEKRYIRELSLGNKQRIGVASSLLGSPQVILLDEPFANLDPSSQVLIKKILRPEVQERIVLISSHNLYHLKEIATHFMLVETGKLVLFEANTETIFQRIQHHFEEKLEE